MSEQVRATMQPTVLIEVDERERKVLEHQGLLFTGTDEELAAHYRAAGLEVPADVKPAAAQPGAGKSDTAAKTTTTSSSEQAKGA